MTLPEDIRRQRLIDLGFPLVDVRDISTHWKPIRSNHARLRDPTTAIFPQTWKAYPNNPLLLYNPVQFACRDDPLRGRIIPKKHSWMLTTRYGGLKALKWRKWGLARQKEYQVAKEEADAHHGYDYVSEPNYHKPSLVIEPTDVTLLANAKLAQGGRTCLSAENISTDLAIGDVICSRERQKDGPSIITSLSTRKRKAESLRPDFVVPVSNEASNQRTADYARPSAHPQNFPSCFCAGALRPMSWARKMMTYFTGPISSVTSCLYEFVNRRSNVVEQRILDTRTGNVASKKRRIFQSEDDEPAWIDEEARARLWNLHIERLHQGLSQARICIKDQHVGNLGSQSLQRYGYRRDKFEHLKLESFVTLVIPIAHTASIVEHLYSRRVLERAKHYNRKPKAHVRYDLESEDDKLSIKLAISLLRNFPPDLRRILDVWHVDGTLLRTVCNDLEALLEERPIPSLVVNTSSETNEIWERMALSSQSVDVVMTDAPNTTVSAPARLTMPGSFPEEEPGHEADPEPGSREYEPMRSPPAALPEVQDPLKDGLPTLHETIPLDLIQAHLVDSRRADTYSENSPPNKHRHRSMRSVLKGKLKSPLSPTPKRLQQAAQMKKSVHFTFNTTPRTQYKPRDHALDHTNYWPRSSGPSSSTSPVSGRSTSRSLPSHIQRRKSAHALRHTTAASVASTTSGSPHASHHNAGHYTVFAGGREAGDAVFMGHESQSTNVSSPITGRKEGTGVSPSHEDVAFATSGESLPRQDLADEEQDTHKSARNDEDEQEKQAEESDSNDESREDRERDVLTRHGASINSHMQEGLRKYYRHSLQSSGSDIDQKLSGLQISDERQSALDEIALRRQVEEEEREALAAATAKAAAEAEKKRADAEKLQKTGGLRAPRKTLVAPLSNEWMQKVKASVSRQGAGVARTFEGTELTPRDFAKVVPPTEWLNDEIINGTFLWLDRFINLAAGVSDTRSVNRRCLVLSSFLWKRIQDAGPGSTGRALRRFGVSKANFGDLDTVLLPVCENSHWTLIVVRPKMRTIAHMDSLSVAGSASKLKLAQAWVKAVLEDKFAEDEWKVVRHEAPRQTNGYDCGVHTITNGMCIALGLNAIDAYASDQMPLQRLRIAAMLLNEGFSKDFDLAGL